MRIENGMIFFWSGYFSNWYMTDIIIDNIKFNCAEQYIMYRKAKLFNDNEMLEKIMKSTDPEEQKKFGRQVRDFKEEVWNEVIEEVAFTACYEKFSQNSFLKETMLTCIDKEFVEASPEDTIWGIGLIETDDRVLDKNKWLGKNILGKALDKTRKKLLENKSNQEFVNKLKDSLKKEL